MLYLIIFVLAATFQPEINEFFSQDFGFSSPHAVFEVYAICAPVSIVLLLILAVYDIVCGLLWTAGGSFHFVRDKKPSTATIVFAFAWVIIYATAIAAAVVGTAPATVASMAVAYIVSTAALHIAYPKRTRVLVSRRMAKVSASVSASMLVSAADLIKSPMTASIAVWMVALSAQCICIPFAIVPVYLKAPAITELTGKQEEPETITEATTKELLPKPIAWIATSSVKHQGCAVVMRKLLPAPAARVEETGAVIETEGKNAIAAAKLLACKNDAAAEARARAIIAVVQVLAKGTIAAAEAQAREAIVPATTQTNKAKSPAEILGNGTNAPIQAAKAPPVARRKRTRSRRTRKSGTSTRRPMLLVVPEGLESNIELMFGTIAVKG